MALDRWPWTDGLGPMALDRWPWHNALDRWPWHNALARHHLGKDK
jgi:hypothetical protein